MGAAVKRAGMSYFSTLGASTENNHIFFSPRAVCNSDARNSCGVQKASSGFSYHGGAAGVAEQGHRFGTGYRDSPTPQHASVIYDYPKRKNPQTPHT